MKAIVFFRAITSGRYRFARFLLKNAVIGLTHRYCPCGTRKGLSTDRLCARCMLRNIEIGLTCDICGCSPFRDCGTCDCECHAIVNVIKRRNEYESRTADKRRDAF